MQVDDVGGAAAVDVGQPDALVVELVRVVEPGRVVHRDLGAEAAVAEVGPVADLAVADAHEVGEAIAAQVGEIDGLRAVGEDQARAFLFVQRLSDAAGRAEALLGQRGVPDEGVVFGDQHVGVAVAVEVDELQVRVAHVAVEARGEGAEGLPAFVVVVLVEAGHRAVQHHQIGLAVAGQVHELRLPAGQGEVGFDGDAFRTARIRPACFADRAEVALVEPGAGLLGEDAGDAFAVQIGPLVGRAVQPDGQVLQALRRRPPAPCPARWAGCTRTRPAAGCASDSRRCCGGSRSG